MSFVDPQKIGRKLIRPVDCYAQLVITMFSFVVITYVSPFRGIK